jgi:cleavage stimulation factor subunit 1
LFSQLFYDGHSTIASSLAAQVNVDPPCSPSDRLMSVVTKGLQHETDRQKESEQALNLNPIQQMLIGPGIGILYFIIYIKHQFVYLFLYLNLIRFGI